MIEYIEGDIFKSPAQVIVNTVNTMGVMGKGLALEFKQRYPKCLPSIVQHAKKAIDDWEVNVMVCSRLLDSLISNKRELEKAFETRVH